VGLRRGKLISPMTRENVSIEVRMGIGKGIAKLTSAA